MLPLLWSFAATASTPPPSSMSSSSSSSSVPAFADTLFNKVPYVAPPWVVQHVAPELLPSSKVALGRLPTPIHALKGVPGLEATGLICYIKRDDLSSFDLSGNKVHTARRMLRPPSLTPLACRPCRSESSSFCSTTSTSTTLSLPSVASSPTTRVLLPWRRGNWVWTRS